MKTRLLFLLLSFFYSSLIISQSIGDVIYSSQEQVDNNNPTGDFVFKRIIFEGESIVDLTPLLGLITDCKELVIRNTSLVDLSGLDSLTYACGITSQAQQWIFSINGELSILDNPLLENLNGLQNLRKTTNVTIKNNPSLKNTNVLNIQSFGVDAWGDGTGFNEQLDPSIIIEDNDNLEILVGFDSLKAASKLRVSNNLMLKDLTTFHNLEGIIGVESSDYIGDLQIIGNTSLVDLAGLENVESALNVVVDGNENLKSCQGLGNCLLRSFTVRNNPALEELGTFSLNLDRYVLDTSPMVFTISNNPQLHSIELDSVHFGSSAYNDELWITITENERLEACNVDYICESFGFESIKNIYDNAEGCNSVDQVFEQCGVKETLFVGRLGIDDSCSFLFDEENSFDKIRIRDSLSGQILTRSDLNGIFSFSLINVAFDSVLIQAENIENLFGPFENSFKVYNTDTIPGTDTIRFNYCPDYFSDLSVEFDNFNNDIELGGDNVYTICYTNNGNIPDEGSLYFQFLESEDVDIYIDYKELGGGVLSQGMIEWGFTNLGVGETECKEIVVGLPADFPQEGELFPKISIASTADFDIRNVVDDCVEETQSYIPSNLRLTLQRERNICTIHYQLVIRNQGDMSESDLIFFYFEDLPENFLLDFVETSDAEVSGDTLMWEITNLGLNSVQTFEVSIRISSSEYLGDSISVAAQTRFPDNNINKDSDTYICEVSTLFLESQADVDECGCVKEVSDVLVISETGGPITNLDTLTYLERVEGRLIIERINNLSSLKGLENLSVLGELSLDRNSLTSLEGMSNLKELDILSISNLPLLTSLEGLENIIHISDALILENNDLLTSIWGLNPNSIEMNSVRIEKNNNLEWCKSDFLCRAISNENIDIQIKDNEEGCNSIAQLQESCVSSTSENEGNLLIYTHPNPVKDVLHIDNPDNLPIDHLEIYDLHGRRVFTKTIDGTSDISVDLSSLLSGMYLVKIQSNNQEVIKKFVKE